MANAYTQDIILDADGKPVLDALALVRNFMGEIQKAVTGIGVTSVADAKKWQTELALNLKMLSQAQRDLNTLQSERNARAKGFADAEGAARRIAKAEVSADKEANRQKTIEAKNYYGERNRIAREEANAEKQIAREIAEFEKSQDRAAIASAREVAAARREAATAAVTAKARGITNRDDAIAAKAASDARLAQLRREREATAANDADGARGIANRIAVEKALGTALDTTIRKLNQQAEAERRASDAATARLRGESVSATRLLAPGNVRDEFNRSGDPRASLVGYQFEQELARKNLQAQLASKTATLDQVVAARQRLQLANENVNAAERLVREDEKQLALERQLGNTQRLEQQRAQLTLAGQYAREQIAALGPKEAMRRATEATAAAEQRLATASAEHVTQARQEVELARAQQRATEQQTRGGLFSTGYVANAFARTAIYGLAAGAAYGAFNAVKGGVEQVVEMEDEMAKLQAIANATDPALQKMKASIYSIGEASRFSVIDLAKISQTLAQAGVTANQMEDVLRSVTTLATASGSTPDEAVNLVTSALGSFQLQASEASRVADLMTSALNRTKLTVQQTGQAIQYVGATAFEQNISLEQLLATVGAIAQAGVRSGSTIGTGFRQFLVDLQTPSEKLTTQLKAVGLAASDVNVSVRGLPAVLKSLGDAGFGSAQAYGGLETRAAAFYLVAKNNVAIMDQLQMSFAQQGAAAIANERAMNSLTSQWQRFKNILADSTSGVAEDFLAILQGSVTALSDLIQKMKEYQELKDGQKESTIGQSLATVGSYTAAGAGTGAVAGLPFAAVGAGPGALVGGTAGFFYGLKRAMDTTSQSYTDFSTRVADASEKVDSQAGKINELDKEMGRLLTQQDGLKDGSNQVNVETVNLTARFEGLAKYLTNTKDRYGDLIQAMQKYREEAVQTQTAYLNGQIALNDQQATASRARATDLANRALNDPRFRGDAELIRALRAPRQGANGTIITEKARSYNDPTLSALAQELGNLATALADANLGRARRNDAVSQNTKAGQTLNQRVTAGESELPRFSSLTQAEQVAKAPALRTQMQSVVAEIKNRLVNPQTARAAIPTLQGYLSRSEAVLKGIEAAVGPTKKETAANAKAEREAAKAERAREKTEKLVSQVDVDRVGTELGLKLGSGTRTKEEQNRLYARGVTPATGDTSSHSNGGVARDFNVAGLSDAEAERMATTMRARYRAAGINAQVQFETGKGKGQGTGRHIHVGVRKGTTRRGDRTDELEDQNGVQLARDQIALDQENLKSKLKDVAVATTSDTFDKAVTAAKAALDKVNDQLRPAALHELATAGIAPGTAQFKLKLAQVDQEIAQNIADFNQKVTDALIKSVDLQVKAAQTAFDTATQGAQRRAQLAQSSLSGFDNYSLRGRVPEYARQLASDRVAASQEDLTRAQYNALPAQIAAQQEAMNGLASTVATKGADAEQVAAKLNEMNLELQKLIDQRDALAAQLGASALLPQTIGDGINQAIAAYRQANPEGNDVTSIFLGRIGDDINNWASTIQNGVGSVMDDLINHPMESLKVAGDWFKEFFSSVGKGTTNVLSLFGRMAQGIISYIGQIAAKAVATQIVNLLLNLATTAIGGSTAKANANASYASGVVASGGQFAFNGGRMGDAPGTIYRSKGGAVENGSVTHDSVDAKLARGEWVINKDSVDSVGNKFMARLNQHGAKALEGLQAMPSLDMRNHTETNVWVVPAAQQPTMGPNDVRVILTDELMNGDGKRLVQSIARDR